MLQYLNNSIIKYLLVGAVGFVVDGGLLSLLTNFGMNAMVARGVSLSTALLTTWILHRTFTFQVKAPPSLRELAKYLASNLFGAAVNYCLYFLLVYYILGQQLWLALALASVVALAVNYLGARFIAFKHG